MLKAIITCGLILASQVYAANFEDDFVVVFVDSETEAEFGPVPLERELLATGIEEIARAGAKGIVLKFFIDLPKDTAGDDRLAVAIQQLPVALQASITDERSPNPFPEQFFLDLNTSTTIRGSSGWIPLPMFSEHASDIGFVDFAGFPAPLLETYQGRPVKSLLLCAVELALEEQGRIEPGVGISFTDQTYRLTPRNEMTFTLVEEASIDYIPFHSVVRGIVDPERLQGKVVILGYDGPSIQSLDTPVGTITVHRLFIQLLKGFYESGT
jgi:CHASE2 domain-containing sensor protein